MATKQKNTSQITAKNVVLIAGALSLLSLSLFLTVLLRTTKNVSPAPSQAAEETAIIEAEVTPTAIPLDENSLDDIGTELNDMDYRVNAFPDAGN